MLLRALPNLTNLADLKEAGARIIINQTAPPKSKSGNFNFVHTRYGPGTSRLYQVKVSSETDHWYMVQFCLGCVRTDFILVLSFLTKCKESI